MGGALFECLPRRFEHSGRIACADCVEGCNRWLYELRVDRFKASIKTEGARANVELVGGEEDVLRGASRGFYDRLLWDYECLTCTSKCEIGIHQLVLAIAVRELNTIACYTCGNPCDKEQSKHENYGYPVLTEWIFPSVMLVVFMRVWFV